MARVFTEANVEGFEFTTSIGTYPFSMGCWIYKTAVTPSGENQMVMTFDGNTGDSVGITCEYGNGTTLDDVVAGCWDESGSAWGEARANSILPMNDWYSLVAVFTSATYRAMYVDASLGDTDSTNIPIEQLDEFYIGFPNGWSVNNGVDANLAFVAVWNTNLTQSDVDMFDAGMSPLQIRAPNLVHYVPLIRYNNDYMTGEIGFDHLTNPAVIPTGKRIYTPRFPITPGIVVPQIRIMGEDTKRWKSGVKIY